MNKIRYNYEYLQTYCNDNNITLLKDYSNENITIHSKIECICLNNNCKVFVNKKFRYILETGAYCKNCTKINRQSKLKETCLKKFGVEYALQSKEIKDKIKETNLKKYGVEYASQTKELKDKVKETNLKKYGYICPLQNSNIQLKAQKSNITKYGTTNPMLCEEIKNKLKNTFLEKYGVEYPTQSAIIRETMKINNLSKYGVEYVSQVNIFKEKRKETSLEKYGVEYSAQNPEIMEKTSKNAYKAKEYIMPSGNIIKCQGYESLALDELLQKELIEEQDIVTGCKNVPTIWYNDEDNKKHRHYVDIFIPSQNRCIEVKSTWTAEKKKDNIFLKQQASKDLGYKYEIWVYNAKGERVETYY